MIKDEATQENTPVQEEGPAENQEMEPSFVANTNKIK